MALAYGWAACALFFYLKIYWGGGLLCFGSNPHNSRTGWQVGRFLGRTFFFFGVNAIIEFEESEKVIQENKVVAAWACRGTARHPSLPTLKTVNLRGWSGLVRGSWNETRIHFNSFHFSKLTIFSKSHFNFNRFKSLSTTFICILSVNFKFFFITCIHSLPLQLTLYPVRPLWRGRSLFLLIIIYGVHGQCALQNERPFVWN